MSPFWIAVICAAGLLFIINVLSVATLLIALKRKSVIDLVNNKFIRKTEWGIYLPKLAEGVERFHSLPKERVSIRSFDGLNLVGYYFPCPRKTKRYALLMHGYNSCGKNDFGVAIDSIHEMGLNLLIPDQRAHGESEGKYIGFGILERFDCKAWCEYLVERFGKDIQIAVGGISMGATTVLMASGLDLPEQVKCIYADCGFTSPLAELKHIQNHLLHLPAAGMLFGAGIICRLVAGYNVKELTTADALKKAKKPILFIHGKKDRLVPYQFSLENYEACASDKELFLVEEGLHGTSFFADNEGYRKKLKEFIDKYFDKAGT